MAKTAAERMRALRARRGGKTLLARVEALEWQLKAQENRIVALESRPHLEPLVRKDKAVLDALRDKIASVPPRRPQPLHVPNPPQMPVQPYGEWEPS